MTKIIERAHQYPQPYDFSEKERRGDAPFCTLQPGRGSRHENLEAVRFVMTTLQEMVAAIQSDWPIDRPKTQRVKDCLCHSDFTIARVRNGALRRMAESAQLHPSEAQS